MRRGQRQGEQQKDRVSNGGRIDRGRKEEREGRKREKSESFVGIRSTRHGGLIKGLFQSLTESSREGEMIKTRSTPRPPLPPLSLALPSPPSSPPLSPVAHHCLLRVLPAPKRTSSSLRRHSVPSAILINVILQPQSRYLQFVSREDAQVADASRPNSSSVVRYDLIQILPFIV